MCQHQQWCQLTIDKLWPQNRLALLGQNYCILNFPLFERRICSLHLSSTDISRSDLKPFHPIINTDSLNKIERWQQYRL